MTDRPDIFISYPHSEHEFAKKLHLRLRNCRRQADGEIPKIFIDDDRDSGIRASLGWRRQVAEAADTCRHFLPLYSEMFFRSNECLYELDIAIDRDPRGGMGIVTPLMTSKCTIPPVCKLIQYISVEDAPQDWFARLCAALNLQEVNDKLVLKFLEQPPGKVQVNQTLPPLRIRMEDASGQLKELTDQISLRTEKGSLQGEITKTTEKGLVTFSDLSLDEPAQLTRLIAECAGFGMARSESFQVEQPTVLLPEPPPSESPAHKIIPATGRPVFFADGKALAVIGEDSVSTFRLDTLQPLLPEPLSLTGRLRHILPAEDLLVLCDWEGFVHVLGHDGCNMTWSFRDGNRPINVVGGIALANGSVYLGLWSGEVFRFDRTNNPELLFRHAVGVQAIGVAGPGNVGIVDLEGNLAIYQDGVCVRTSHLEHRVFLLKNCGNHLIALGRERFYLIPWDGSRMLPVASLVGGAAAVLGDSARPVVIDEQGRGVRIDHELGSQGIFHTVSGARPTSADDQGKWCVLENPGGSHTLLLHEPRQRQGRIIHSHDGALAISPNGRRLAVGEPEGIRLIEPQELDKPRDPSV